MADGVWQWPWLENRHKAVITAWFIKAKALEETYTPGSQGWLTSKQTALYRNIMSLLRRLYVYPPIYFLLLPEEESP